MRTTELFEMLKGIGKSNFRKQLTEKKDNDEKSKKKAKGKPDTIIINPTLNSTDQRR